MTTKTRAAQKQWTIVTEKFESGGKPTVDRENSIIRGAKIASWMSENGRDYGKALKGHAKLYEGAPVSLNHPQPGAVPTVESRFGIYRNVSEAADGIYGDLHYNPKHPNAEQIIWAVENQPSTIANSHRVDASTRKRSDGMLEVLEILKVRGVELVTEGGMNRTLFEATVDADSADPENKKQVDAATGVPAEPDPAEPKVEADTPMMTACIARVMATGKDQEASRAICSAAIATDEPKAESEDEEPEGEKPPEEAPAEDEAEDEAEGDKKSKPVAESLAEANVGDQVIIDDCGTKIVGEVLKKAPALLVRVGNYLRTVWDDGAIVAAASVAATPPQTESRIMGNKTLAELSESDLRAARPDVFAKRDAEAKELKEFRDAKAKADAEAAGKAKLDARRKLCEDAKLPKAAITDAFVESLVAVSDDTAKALIEERRRSVPGPAAKSTSRTAPDQSTNGTPKLTGEALAEALLR